MAEEALACFQNLIVNVPDWLSDLDKIVKCANERQKQLLLENQACEKSEHAKIHRKKESKSSSLQSRPRDSYRNAKTNNLDMLRPQLPHLSDADALRLAQRQRKTNSVSSGHPTASTTYRSRSLIVIYYDGEVQRRFEKLVRAVGSSRNCIRKGKMGAKVDALSRIGSSGSESGGSGDDSPFASKHQYMRTSRSSHRNFGYGDGVQIFDKVDGRLEKGQTLCERAAHQILRDGDCYTEVNKIRDFFHEALSFAAEELPSLRRRAERSALRRERSEERRRAAVTSDAAATREYVTSSPIILHAVSSGDMTLEVDALEADDDDGEDAFGEYDINSFQMGKLHLRRGPPMNSLRAFA